MATTCKLIAKQVLGSSAANVEFTSIPGTYTDLLLVHSARSDRGSGNPRDEAFIRINGDTGSNYSGRQLYGTGSAAGSSSNSSQTAWIRMNTAASAATSNTFGNAEIYIPNYANTTTNKSASATTCYENNGTEAYIEAMALLWSSTAAITSLRIYPEVGPNWVSGSSFFLYGITKA